jgi:hypothetical protein
MKRWIMPTLQTGSRPAGTRGLPRWGHLTRLESRENDRRQISKAVCLGGSVICYLSFVILNVPIGLSQMYGGNNFGIAKAGLYCAEALR